MEKLPLSYYIGLDYAQSAKTAINEDNPTRWELFDALACLSFAEAARGRCDDN